MALFYDHISADGFHSLSYVLLFVQKAAVFWSNSTELVQKAEVQLKKLSGHQKHVLAFISTQIQNHTTEHKSDQLQYPQIHSPSHFVSLTKFPSQFSTTFKRNSTKPAKENAN